MKQVNRLLGPEIEPVTLAQAKAFTYAPESLDDAMIGALIRAARNNVENWLEKATIYQTVVTTLFDGTVGLVELKGPLVSVQSVVMVDGGVSTTLAPENYYIQLARDLIVFFNAVEVSGDQRLEITYTSGMAEDGSEMPPAINQAILHAVAHGYTFRENDEPLPQIAKMLLAPFRRIPL